jgi:hypothetical protein
MINNKISVIPRIYKPSEVQDVELKVVLRAIQTGIAYGQDIRGITQEIQSEPDHTVQNKMKYELLPVAMFNGTFSYKKDQSIKDYSSFTAIDLDNFSSGEEMNNAKMMLMKDSCVYAIYTTPSGRGLKAVIIHDNLVTDYHGELYEQLLGRYQISTIDTSVSDLSRGNYICYDPDIYFNYNPIPYHFIHNPAYTPKQKPKSPCSRAGSAYDIRHLRLMLGFKHPVGNKSDDSIIAILNSFWKKQPDRWRVGNRKNSVFQAASELCKTGVNIDRALDYLVNAYTAVGLPIDDIMYQGIHGYQCNYEAYGINRTRFNGYGKRR